MTEATEFQTLLALIPTISWSAVAFILIIYVVRPLTVWFVKWLTANTRTSNGEALKIAENVRDNHTHEVSALRVAVESMRSDLLTHVGDCHQVSRRVDSLAQDQIIIREKIAGIEGRMSR